MNEPEAALTTRPTSKFITFPVRANDPAEADKTYERKKPALTPVNAKAPVAAGGCQIDEIGELGIAGDGRRVGEHDLESIAPKIVRLLGYSLDKAVEFIEAGHGIPAATA
jgi:hypothetical protein